MLRFYPSEHRKTSDKRQISVEAGPNGRKEAQDEQKNYKMALIEQMRAKLTERMVHKNADN